MNWLHCGPREWVWAMLNRHNDAPKDTTVCSCQIKYGQARGVEIRVDKGRLSYIQLDPGIVV
jgi:hypothetical protein